MKIKIENSNYRFLGLIVLAFCCIGAMNISVAAQARDPFARPVVRPKFKPGSTAAPKKGPTAVLAPPIQQRIDSYKALRLVAAQNGVPAPKPTTVLTIDEMQVTGIFRTPRGYAAMVEASPIKLSYTIYPGEKFYDGQLVAIEESRLVFRRETRMTDGKSIIAAVNKGLVQQSINDMAATRTETTVPAVSAPTAATSGAAVSADAVPMQESKDAKAAPETGNASPASSASPSINTSPLQPNSIKDSKAGSNNSAATSSTETVIINEETKTEEPATSKAKTNRTKKKKQ